MDKNSKTISLAGKLLIPSLTIACLSHGIVDLILQVFLPVVSVTFFGSSDPVNIAITRQLDTISWSIAAVFALLLGVISVKYNHKKLLVLGILCIPIGALGCSLAPNFILMQIFYVIEGIGTTIIGVASNTLVGEILPLNKRPQATAWIMAGGISATVTGNFVIRLFFADSGNWQAFLLWFAVPISVISLIVAIFGIPSFTPKLLDTTGTGAYLNAFKKIFKKKSAAACLIGNMLRVAGAMWVPFYVAFLTIDKLWLSLADAALVFIGVQIVNIFGGLIGGYLVNRIGRKRLPVITLPIEGLTIPLLAFAPDLVISLIILYFNSFIGFFGNPGLINLTFEQVPEFRGTINSLVSSLSFLGIAIGTGIGGLVLAIFGYTSMFFVYGLIILVAVAVIFFLTVDPCLSNQSESIKSISA